MVVVTSRGQMWSLTGTTTSQHHAQCEQDDHHPKRGLPGALVDVSPRGAVQTCTPRAAQPPLAPQLECTAILTTPSQPICESVLSWCTAYTRPADRVYWCCSLAHAAERPSGTLVLARDASLAQVSPMVSGGGACTYGQLSSTHGRPNISVEFVV